MKHAIRIFIICFILFLASYVNAEQQDNSESFFDSRYFQNEEIYEYDKFDKTWNYSCASIIVKDGFTAIQIGTNIHGDERSRTIDILFIVRAADWENGSWVTSSFVPSEIYFLINDDIMFTIQPPFSFYSDPSHVGLYLGENGEKLYKAISNCNSLSIKIVDNNGKKYIVDFTEEELSNLFSSGEWGDSCKKIINSNIFKYNTMSKAILYGEGDSDSQYIQIEHEELIDSLPKHTNTPEPTATPTLEPTPIPTATPSPVSTSFTEEITFTEVVDKISNVTINNQPVFGIGKESALEIEGCGAGLVWQRDDDKGYFVLLDNNSTDSYIWQQIDPNNVANTFELIGNLLLEYINYDNGGKIYLYIIDNQSASNVFVNIVYSSNLEALNKDSSVHYDTYFDDWDSFSKVATRYLDHMGNFVSKAVTTKAPEFPEKLDNSKLKSLAEAVFSKILKNPDSLQIHNLYTKDLSDSYLAIVEYSAMNGFGGYNRDTLEIQIDYYAEYTRYTVINVFGTGQFVVYYSSGKWTVMPVT